MLSGADTIGKFYVIQEANKGYDSVRRIECNMSAELKSRSYVKLKNEQTGQKLEKVKRQQTGYGQGLSYATPSASELSVVC